MLDHLHAYWEPILQACLLFPFVAAVFTLPFLVFNYRKYGGISMMRVITVYSFILYSLCAFLLTVLPLPSREAVAAMPPKPIGWIPFHDLYVGLTKAGFDFSSPATLVNPTCWKAFLTSSDLFSVLANVVMQIPLGFYLRYYFRCGWKKTLLIGLSVSLFYELTQLSGLFFIYPKPYRYAEVDDLIANTLGAMIGYGLAPLLAFWLPSREEMDRVSYCKGEQVTWMRRAVAAAADALLYGAAVTGGWAASANRSLGMVGIGCFMTYFVLIPWLMNGRTAGQWLLRLRVTHEDGSRPTPMQFFVRYALMYGIEPIALYSGALFLIALAFVLVSSGFTVRMRLVLIAASALTVAWPLWLLLRCLGKWNTLPHNHFSHTAIRKEAFYSQYVNTRR